MVRMVAAPRVSEGATLRPRFDAVSLSANRRPCHRPIGGSREIRYTRTVGHTTHIFMYQIRYVPTHWLHGSNADGEPDDQRLTPHVPPQFRPRRAARGARRTWPTWAPPSRSTRRSSAGDVRHARAGRDAAADARRRAGRAVAPLAGPQARRLISRAGVSHLDESQRVVAVGLALLFQAARLAHHAGRVQPGRAAPGSRGGSAGGRGSTGRRAGSGRRRHCRSWPSSAAARSADRRCAGSARNA